MNLKFKIFTLLLAFLSFTCKEDKKETPIKTATEETTQKQPNKLVFEIDLTTTQPDDFRFFANNIFLNNNQFMNISVGQQLNNNETSKNMRFEFPENVKPDAMLGFVLGVKKEKDVEIKTASLSYGDTKFIINTDQLNDFFTFNKFIEYNSETKTLQARRKDNRLNPTLYVRRKILDSIQYID
jgi:hypothetical protein